MRLEIPRKVESNGDKGMGSHGRAEALRTPVLGTGIPLGASGWFSKVCCKKLSGEKPHFTY